MTAEILEVAQNNRYLSLFRGFVKISGEEGEIGRVALDNVETIILSGHGATLSKNLMVALAERNIVTIICGTNYQPVSITMPIQGHFQSAGILWDQIDSSRPLQKRLWQSVVREKINNQAALLVESHKDSADTATGSVVKAIKQLNTMSRKVLSGDSANKEAHAARLYWPALMGKAFRRNRENPDINSALNYGYAVLRSAIARAICGAGLHPAIGVHHKNRNNGFCLADDLIEPFRPFADYLAMQIVEETKGKNAENEELVLTPDIKKKLASVLTLHVEGEKGLTPLNNAIGYTVLSLRDSFSSGKNKIWLPKFKKEFLYAKRSEDLGEWV